MRRLYIFILFAALAVMNSCMKDTAPSSALKVTLDKLEYRAGDTVKFLFEGKPDNIVFYSGEPGSDYDCRHNYDRHGILYLDFSSFVRYGVPARNISILASLDFNGSYDMESIGEAEWYNMSERFVWSTGDDRTPSGEIELNSFLEEASGRKLTREDKIYIAFHYTDYTDADRTRQNNWIIRSSDIRILSPFGDKSNLADMQGFGWTSVPEKKWTISPASAPVQILIDGKKEPRSDAWAVSRAFSIGGVPADEGKAIKSISTSMDSYSHIYQKPGVYTAVFESSSVWYTGGNSSLTEVTVNVSEADVAE